MSNVETVEVDPAKAAELARLAAVSYVSARLKGPTVMSYTEAMLDGSWEFNGYRSLRFNADGTKLLSGLSSLMAVVLSGTTQHFVLERLPDSDDPELPVPSWHNGPRVCDVKPDPNAGF